MIGFGQKSGPEAISFGNTLYRISEISWIKAAGTSIPEKVAKGLLWFGAALFIYTLAQVKGTYLNLESLLALLPLHLGYLIKGDLRLACTGDFEESYEDRVGRSGKLFREWIDGLAKRQTQWLRLNDGDYEYLLNPERLAWARPRINWSIYPVVVAALLYAYMTLLKTGWAPEAYPFLTDLLFLEFPGGERSSLYWQLYLMIIAAVGAFGLSFKRSVEFCAPGGVQDMMWMTAADQALVLDVVSGRRKPGSKSASQAAKTSAKAAASSPPKEAKKPQPVEPKPVEAKPTSKPAEPSGKTPEPAHRAEG